MIGKIKQNELDRRDTAPLFLCLCSADSTVVLHLCQIFTWNLQQELFKRCLKTKNGPFFQTSVCSKLQSAPVDSTVVSQLLSRSRWTIKFSQKKGCVHLQDYTYNCRICLLQFFIVFGLKNNKISSGQMRPLYAYVANQSTQRIGVVVLNFFSLSLSLSLSFSLKVRVTISLNFIRLLRVVIMHLSM